MHFPNCVSQLAILLSALFLSSSALAATISGTITDASNGDPVVFATVRILELAKEVHTDADGKYIFEKIPAGRYTVAVTFAGYLDYAIGVVETSAGSAKTLDAALQPDTAPTQQEREESDGHVSPSGSAQSANSIRESPIRLSDMPIRGYEDYIAIQPGTVRRFYGAPVHVRGGRIEEFGYNIDGFSQQDPFTGQSFTAINANSIDDIRFYPGYSDPSHGQLASGRAEISTRETWSKGGSIEAITDNFHGERSNYNLYALDLSGPFPTTAPGQLTYAVAGEYRTFGNRDPGGPGDWSYLGAWHGNLRWRPSDRTSTLIGTRGSYEDWKYTPRAYLFDAVHAPRGTDANYSVFGTFEHDIARRTKLSASANWFSVSHRQGDGAHFDDIWGYGRPSGNPRFDQTTLFWSWDDIYLDQDSLANQRYIPVQTPVIESTLTVTLPGGESTQKSFIFGGDEGSVWDDYFKQNGSYIGGRAELSRGHPGGVTEGGVEFQHHTVRAYHHLFPTLIYQGRNGGFDDINRYGYDELGNEIDDDVKNGVKHPLFVAGYLNEHLNWRELSLDFGLRWDHFDYDGMRLVDPNNPLDPSDRRTYADTASGLTQRERDSLLQTTNQLDEGEIEEADPVDRLSPRLAATFAVGAAGRLFVGIGRYVQHPAFRDLYSDFRFLEYKVLTGGYAYTFGNPSIEPTSVTLYEAGWELDLIPSIGFHVRGYYKDILNRLGIGGAAAIPNGYQIVDNIGDATAKGIELRARLECTRGLDAIVTYTHSSVEERGNIFDAPSNIAWTNAEPPRPVTAPTWYDQRHRIVGNVDFRYGPESGPHLGNWHPFENAGLNVLADIGSGFPYIPLAVYNEVTLGAISPRPLGPVNSEQSDWTYRVDGKANKSMAIAGADLELYIWVINLFDHENVVDVYNGTGQPDNTGWLETGEGQQFVINNGSIHDSSFLTGEQKYNLRENDPANFDIPRQIRFGMRVGF